LFAPFLLIAWNTNLIHAGTVRGLASNTDRSLQTKYGNVFHGSGTGGTVVATQQAISGSCVLSDGGFYGAYNTNPYTVDFLYQAAFVNGTSSADVQFGLLPMLDKAIPQGILPLLFPSTCARRARQIRESTLPHRYLQSAPQILGISSQIEDLMTQAGDCKCQ
jgi:hypothetical protein